MNFDFSSLKVLVIGDIMLDEYIYGSISRVSQETPVHILKMEYSSYSVGGAANVAQNILSLGAHCRIIGIAGNDNYCDRMKTLLKCKTNIIKTSKPTTVKTRFIGNNHQVLRVDSENNECINKKIESKLCKIISSYLPLYDVVIISDYAKGVCSRSICSHIITESNKLNVPVLVDPKGSDWSKYNDASLITPNINELSIFKGYTVENNDTAVETAMSELYDIKSFLVTRSEKGMSIFSNSVISHIPTYAKDVCDVSGAGDTVIAVMALCMASGFSLENSANIANKAAGLVVGKFGTVPISIKDLNDIQCKKIITKKTLKEIVSMVRKEKKTIVFTNGCFDILHKGHISYLREASKLGDILIVGINSDNSVKRLKGSTRPINSINDRMEVISELSCVTYVIEFEEETPLKLIKSICPDIICKGGDYTIESVIGSKYAKKTIIVPYVKGYSTTQIFNRVSK